jgi:hypothetical protein
MKRKILQSKDRETKLRQILTGTGNEPSFQTLVSTNIEIIQGLNYYAKNHSEEESKKWSLEWLKTNSPELAKQLNGVKDQFFLNRGFICRMISRGLQLNEKQMEQHWNFFRDLAENKKISKEGAPAPKPAFPKPVPIAAEVLTFEEALDDAIRTGKPIHKFELGTNATALKEVVRLCEAAQKDLEENKDGYNPQTARAIRGTIYKLKEQATGLMVAKKKERVVKAPSTTSKVVTTVKDTVTGVQGVAPQTVIGKKKAVVLDPTHKKIRVFESDTGLEMPRKKIQNFSETRSMEHSIKNMDKFMELAGKRNFNFTRIEKAIKTLKLPGNPIRTGLIREDQVVLMAE